jgi:hypothetical protein
VIAHSQRDMRRQWFREALARRMRDAIPARPPGAGSAPAARRELELDRSSHDFGRYCRDEAGPDIGQLTDAEPIPPPSAEGLAVLCTLDLVRGARGPCPRRFTTTCSADREVSTGSAQAEA